MAYIFGPSCTLTKIKIIDLYTTHCDNFWWRNESRTEN